MFWSFSSFSSIFEPRSVFDFPVLASKFMRKNFVVLTSKLNNVDLRGSLLLLPKFMTEISDFSFLHSFFGCNVVATLIKKQIFKTFYISLDFDYTPFANVNLSNIPAGFNELNYYNTALMQNIFLYHLISQNPLIEKSTNNKKTVQAIISRGNKYMSHRSISFPLDRIPGKVFFRSILSNCGIVSRTFLTKPHIFHGVRFVGNKISKAKRYTKYNFTRKTSFYLS